MLNIPLDNIPEVPVIPTSHNVTKSKDPVYLIYNMVPKCGSSTVGKVIMDLVQENNFVYYSYLYRDFVLNDKEIQGLIDQMKSLQPIGSERKIVFSSHFYHVDFKKLRFNPIMVNVVRDPVQRMISKEKPMMFYIGLFNKLKIIDP